MIFRNFGFLLIGLLSGQFAGAQERLKQVTHPVSWVNRFTFTDINGDELPDILTSSGNSPTGMIRNLGNRTFAPPNLSHYSHRSYYSFDASSQWVEIDGENDWGVFLRENRYLFNPETQPFLVRPNSDGSPSPRIPLPSSSGAPWMPIDLDQDHRTEFIQIVPGAGKSEMKIWSRQTDGTYQAESLLLEPPILGDQAELFDIDLDGQPDLLLRREGSEDICFLKRTGPRTFVNWEYIQPAFTSTTPTDLDGDGLPDLHEKPGDTSLLNFKWSRNTGNVNFASTSHLSPPTLLANWIIAEIVGQPSAPALFSIYRFSSPTSVEKAVVRFGSWETLSSQIIDLTGIPHDSESLQGIEFGDLDGDGHEDLLLGFSTRIPASSNYATTVRLYVSWGNSDSSFTPPAPIHSPPVATSLLATADFDGNGSTDIICGPDQAGLLRFMTNSGQGRFPESVPLANLTPPVPSPENYQMTSLLTGDINGDSIPDLAITWQASIYDGDLFLGIKGATGIALGQGDGTFSSPSFPSNAFTGFNPRRWKDGLLVDWDLDGDLDLIVHGNFMANTGNAFSLTQVPLISGTYFEDILGNPLPMFHSTTGDLDGDGFPDISSAVASYDETTGQSTFAIAFGAPGGGIAQTVHVPATLYFSDLLGNRIPGDVSFVDLDSDGDLDICTRELDNYDSMGFVYSVVRWRKNPGNGSRNIADWQVLILGRDDITFPSAPLLDFDGDGSPEWTSPKGYIKATSSGPELSPPTNLLGRVELSLYPALTFFNENDVLIRSADFDGDGDADFLISDKYFSLTLVLNPTVEERSAITRHLTGLGVSPHLASPGKDADGDGRSNVEELLHGDNPLLPGGPSPDPFGLNLGIDGSDASVSYRLPRNAGTLDLHYTVQRSTDLREWKTDLTASAEMLFLGGDQVFLRQDVEYEGDRAFFRLHGVHRLDE